MEVLKWHGVKVVKNIKNEWDSFGTIWICLIRGEFDVSSKGVFFIAQRKSL